MEPRPRPQPKAVSRRGWRRHRSEHGRKRERTRSQMAMRVLDELWATVGAPPPPPNAGEVMRQFLLRPLAAMERHVPNSANARREGVVPVAMAALVSWNLAVLLDLSPGRAPPELNELEEMLHPFPELAPLVQELMDYKRAVFGEHLWLLRSLRIEAGEVDGYDFHMETVACPPDASDESAAARASDASDESDAPDAADPRDAL